MYMQSWFAGLIAGVCIVFGSLMLVSVITGVKFQPVPTGMTCIIAPSK